MIDPFAIVLEPKNLSAGLYESFYFRGNSQSGRISFWLKHNLLLFKNDPMIRVGATLILFDRFEKKCTTIHSERLVEKDSFFKEIKGKSWSNLLLKIDDESYFRLSSTELEGTLLETKGSQKHKIHWHLFLDRSQRDYYHLSPQWLYTSSIFPKKKLLTSEIDLQLQGSITLDGKDLVELSEIFVGMNGHNWGREHAALYAYGNCNQFHESPRSPFSQAYFDGYSAKIFLPGGRWLSPFLSGASLMLEGKWYHFNQLIRTFRHAVHHLDAKRWNATFRNHTHTLSVNIEAPDALWVELLYDHPDRKRSLIRNTKFAKGMLSLATQSGTLIANLTSDFFELETLTDPSYRS